MLPREYLAGSQVALSFRPKYSRCLEVLTRRPFSRRQKRFFKWSEAEENRGNEVLTVSWSLKNLLTFANLCSCPQCLRCVPSPATWKIRGEALDGFVEFEESPRWFHRIRGETPD